jgi:serum/glucocorticoid-regulated kinase 2
LENILLGDDGYIVISDFGLSKIMSDPDQMSSTFCGTAAYLAPEVIIGKGYNKAVDWWALGILLFEMTHGYPPFFANNVYVMFEKIKND